MKVPNIPQPRWLKLLAAAVSSGLNQRLHSNSKALATVSKIMTSESDTDGWFTQLGRVPGMGKIELQIWLDDWAHAEYRRVAFCLCARGVTHIQELVALLKNKIVITESWGDEAWREFPDGHMRLTRPLKKHLYDKPIGELYQSTVCVRANHAARLWICC